MRSPTGPGSLSIFASSLAAVALFPTMAHAHVGAGPAAGLWHGFSHPLFGIDHLAAMLAVGIWAAQRGGRALWLLPLTFIAVMTAGGVLGSLAIQIPFVEPAVAASVLVLGVIIAAALRMPLSASALIVAVCAFFHGHAHGSELPPATSAMSYAVGFIVATSLLHLAGLGLGIASNRIDAERLVRYAGGAMMTLGLYLCLA